jgi:flagellin
MLGIRTNISALKSIRLLGSTSMKLSGSVDHISSGKRINSAADDGAGLSVSTRLKADSTSLSQAHRNINDAIGLVQTTEGTVERLSSLVIRLRELSVQASNKTYTSDDRGAILEEMTAILADWKRVSGGAEYNDVAVMNSNNTLSFQVGKDGGTKNTIPLDLSEFNIPDLIIFKLVGRTIKLGRSAIPSIARRNLKALDATLDTLGNMRATLGSTQNRLETALARVGEENNTLQLARSRILDVDYASETANMTRLQIQQQVGIASLSQAKNIPSDFMSLLN